MNATVEIDKSGRLVLPKKMRDALHLVPGTRVVIQQTKDAIVIQPESKPRGLYKKDGVWVYDTGPINPIDAINSVNDAREARTAEMLAAWAAE
jgi:AbrB family looped-hinge helix DNA binding protein